MARNRNPSNEPPLSASRYPSRKKTTGDPRIRVIDAALAIGVERGISWYALDVLLDMRNNVLRDMDLEPPPGGSSS